MEQIYASLIIKGKKTLDEVPDNLKEQVKEILLNHDFIDVTNK